MVLLKGLVVIKVVESTACRDTFDISGGITMAERVVHKRS